MAPIRKYLKLIGMIERRLLGMGEGSFLPSEQCLAEKYGVSKPTLRRALAHLAEAGLVRKLNGVGVMLARCPGAAARELVFLCRDMEYFAVALDSFCLEALSSGYLAIVLPLSGEASDQ